MQRPFCGNADKNTTIYWLKMENKSAATEGPCTTMTTLTTVRGRREWWGDRKTKRLPRQESQLQRFVIVCVWLSSLQSGGGRDTGYDYNHRREGTRRRAPLRHNDEEDCYGHNHAGSTTGEVIRHENDDIVGLRHQTDRQIEGQFAIKTTCVLFTKTSKAQQIVVVKNLLPRAQQACLQAC